MFRNDESIWNHGQVESDIDQIVLSYQGELTEEQIEFLREQTEKLSELLFRAVDLLLNIERDPLLIFKFKNLIKIIFQYDILNIHELTNQRLTLLQRLMIHFKKILYIDNIYSDPEVISKLTKSMTESSEEIPTTASDQQILQSEWFEENPKLLFENLYEIYTLLMHEHVLEPIEDSSFSWDGWNLVQLAVFTGQLEFLKAFKVFIEKQERSIGNYPLKIEENTYKAGFRQFVTGAIYDLPHLVIMGYRNFLPMFKEKTYDAVREYLATKYKQLWRFLRENHIETDNKFSVEIQLRNKERLPRLRDNFFRLFECENINIFQYTVLQDLGEFIDLVKPEENYEKNFDTIEIGGYARYKGLTPLQVAIVEERDHATLSLIKSEPENMFKSIPPSNFDEINPIYVGLNPVQIYIRKAFATQDWTEDAVIGDILAGILESRKEDTSINEIFPRRSKLAGCTPFQVALLADFKILKLNIGGNIFRHSREVSFAKILLRSEHINFTESFPSTHQQFSGYMPQIVIVLLSPENVERSKELINALIKKSNFDINAVSQGYTMLNLAIECELVEMVQFLLENKADCEIETNGENALAITQRKQNDAIEQLILQHKKRMLEERTRLISQSEWPVMDNPWDISSEIPVEELRGLETYRDRVYVLSADRLSLIAKARLGKDISQLNPKELIPFICFRPLRLALHEIIIALNMQIQFAEEEDLFEHTQAIYDFVSEDISQRMPNGYEEEVLSNWKQVVRTVRADPYSFNNKVRKKLEKAHQKFQEHYELLTQTEQDNLDQLLIDVVALQLTKQQLESEIQTLVQNQVNNYIHEHEEILPLTYRQNCARVSWIITGGPASGKGGLAKLIQQDIGEERWADVCNINPDAYKPILKHYSHLEGIPDQYQDTLVHRESSFISKIILSRLLKSVKEEGKGPDVLFDAVKPSDDKSNFSNYGGATSNFYVASCAAEVAVDRAFERGQRKGRYVPTEVLLAGHQAQSVELPNQASQRNVFMHIFDTQTDRTTSDNPTSLQIPIIALSNGLNFELGIRDLFRMFEFVQKININAEAKSQEEVYRPEDIELREKVELLMQYVKPKKIDSGLVLKLQNSAKETYASIKPSIGLVIIDFSKFVTAIQENWAGREDISDWGQLITDLVVAFAEYQFNPEDLTSYLPVTIHEKIGGRKLVVICNEKIKFLFKEEVNFQEESIKIIFNNFKNIIQNKLNTILEKRRWPIEENESLGGDSPAYQRPRISNNATDFFRSDSQQSQIDETISVDEDMEIDNTTNSVGSYGQ